MDVAASEALLDRLWQYYGSDEFVFRHRWQSGDVLMWDNRCTMHRTQIIGEVPVAAGAV
jgi:taurine dioxygenase